MPYLSHSRLARTWLLLAVFVPLTVAFPVGCGGSGSSPVEPRTVLDLGVFSATVPTTVNRSFLNPLDGRTVITALPSTGPISFDPDAFPHTTTGRVSVNLDLTFVPEGSGPAESLLGLRFAAEGRVEERLYEVRATGEEVLWTVTPVPLDFGDLLPGEERALDVGITNGSAQSPVTLTSADVPTAFALGSAQLPITVRPGQTATLAVTYAPPGTGTYGGVLRLGTSDAGGPVNVVLAGESSGSGEMVVDLGTQMLTSGATQELQVEVPASAIGIAIEGRMNPSAEIGLLMFEGPGGKVYENVAGTGPVKWIPSLDAFCAHIPSSDRLSTQLVPGGGTYRFQLYRVAGFGDTMDVHVHIELRAPGGEGAAVLPLNIFLAQGVTPTAATAVSNAHLQDVLTQVDEILGAQYITLGDIDYYDLPDAALDDITQGEEPTLFQQSAAASKTRLNLFLVRSVWSGALLGKSGSIDGAKKKGHTVTGVVSVYFDAQAGAIALVIAHEMLHYLGLWHTVESDGTHDEINDTPNCPATGTDAHCPNEEGGGLLMHWLGNGGKTFTDGQGQVARSHPLLHHAAGGAAALRAPRKPWVPDEATLEFFRTAPPGWCGTNR